MVVVIFQKPVSPQVIHRKPVIYLSLWAYQMFRNYFSFSRDCSLKMYSKGCFASYCIRLKVRSL